jgi:hypothetical protein
MNQPDLSSLQGTWRWQGSESLAYGRMVGGELKVAYCFGGNSRMLGQIFDWRPMGDTLVARFKWVTGALSGFLYLKPVSEFRWEGGWWSALSDDPYLANEQEVPRARAVPCVWVRQPHSEPVPAWAEKILAQA